MKYDDIVKDIERLNKNLFVDDIDNNYINIIYYNDDTGDLYPEIEEILYKIDKNTRLTNISIGFDKEGRQFIYFTYNINIGENTKTEEEEMQEIEDYKEELEFETQKEKMRGIY